MCPDPAVPRSLSAHAILFQVNPLGTDAHSPILPSDAEQSSVCSCLDTTTVQHCGSLVLIAHRLLCQHIAGILQIVRRLCVKCQPSLAFSQTPMSVIGIMTPLPLQAKLGIVEIVRCLWQRRLCMCHCLDRPSQAVFVLWRIIRIGTGPI